MKKREGDLFVCMCISLYVCLLFLFGFCFVCAWEVAFFWGGGGDLGCHGCGGT